MIHSVRNKSISLILYLQLKQTQQTFIEPNHMYPALQRVDENSVTSGRFYLFIGGSWLHFSHSPPPLYLSLSLSLFIRRILFIPGVRGRHLNRRKMPRIRWPEVW